MNLSLLAIEVEAFKNFAARTRVELGDLLPGLHFVRGVNRTNDRLGSNGAGKSTLFSDALTWCLYGRTTGGLRTTDVRSWLTEKPPIVSVTFGDGDREFVVRRGPKATELTIDDRAVGQEDVEALVGMGFEAWKQAVVWGQGQPLFLDLAPRDKMGLLAGALGLERWERRAEAAATRAKALATSLTALEGELEGLETARNHAKAALAEAKASATTWGEEHSAHLLALRGALEETTRVASAVEDERGVADLAAEEAGVKLKLLRPDVEKVREELKQWQSADQNHHHTLDRLETELDSTTEHLKAFAEQGVCPTCGQTVAKKDAAGHTKDLEATRVRLERARNTVSKAHEDATTRVTRTRKSLDQVEESLRALEVEERKRQAGLLTLERRAAETRAARTSAEAALRRAEEEPNPHREAAANARVRLKKIDTALAGGDERAGKLAASAERATFWAKGFREIRLMVVDDVVDDLRATTDAMLEGLGLGDWEVDYATERETLSGTTQRALVVTVRAPGTPENVRWEVYSGGEGQRLRLASALALGEVLLAHAGVQADFRVLDEPTRGLSREGVRDLTDMLAEYAEGAGVRLFYVDHQSSEGLVFRSTVTITNEAGGAQIGRYGP